MKLKRRLLDERKERELATALQAGAPTVHDILDALVSPGRDPRADLPAPLTRQAIVKLSELKPGTILRGTVRNITDFGAFVDIGLHEDGLIHISEPTRQAEISYAVFCLKKKKKTKQKNLFKNQLPNTN